MSQSRTPTRKNLHAAPPRRPDRATSSCRYGQRGERIGIPVGEFDGAIATSGPGGVWAKLPYPSVVGLCVGSCVAVSLVVGGDLGAEIGCRAPRVPGHARCGLWRAGGCGAISAAGSRRLGEACKCAAALLRRWWVRVRVQRGSESVERSAMWRGIDRELRHAARHSRIVDVERLIAAGADPNACEGRADRGPLQLAADGGHLEVIAALLAAGAHVDGATLFGDTPLMYATGRRNTATLEVLIAAGADVNRADRSGRTALHLAARNGKMNMVRLLLEEGARVDLHDMYGKRPIDVVRYFHDCDCLLDVRTASLCHVRYACCVQVCAEAADKSTKAALRKLLLAAEPWGRRRAAAMACYSSVWEE